ncbi:DUF389 domain-containing protein [Sphingomonas sp. Leaf4]|uniref:DUF389 domain-containing protein n=1 Tax=Sphingomonas sp. Leaf4 TaxID=2876553 RepID=UPI001E34B04C|nr:DUF389 domain-containing protein [Sphingomonas sp. Leaf4]
MPAVLARRGRFGRWWRMKVIGSVDHDAVLRQVAEEAGWSWRYGFMIVVSMALSLLGLLMPSVAVLIGAMLVSPLMMPIIGLGFGIAVLDVPDIRKSLFALALGAGLAVGLSALLVALSPIQTITSEIAGRTRPTLFDLLVAFFSALAGAYALIRGRGNTVVGVAIAIALMPPLCVVGFGIATANATVAGGALLLFLTNLVTIALTAAFMARLYGFGRHLTPRNTTFQVVLFAGAMLALSVPLVAALRQISFEAVAQRQVRSAILARFPDDARISQLEIDYRSSGVRVRAVVLTPKFDSGADRALNGELAARLDRRVDLHVDQIRSSLDPQATEAAQIAKAGSGIAPARDRIVGQVALVTGATPDSLAVDDEARIVRATAAELPGLPAAGYRAVEARARAAAPGWQVEVVPPASDAPPPVIGFTAGIADVRAIDDAAWLSARQGRVLAVLGGVAAQREALAGAIVARGGQARVGDAAGALRLGWVSDGQR